MNINEQINKLNVEIETLEERINIIRKEIKHLQFLCVHKKDDDTSSFIYSHTDMFDDYEKCSICGIRKKIK